MKYAFLFCHGWALAAETLFPLAETLKPYSLEQQHIQLGYFEPRSIPACRQDVAWIAVGHSYGFMRVLRELKQQQIPPVAAISLAGFRKFPQSVESVKLLQQSLQRRPERTLTHFHHMHGLTSSFAQRQILDIEALCNDLDELAHHEVQDPGVPHLVLHSAADVLIPNAATLTSFGESQQNTFYDNPTAGHGLGINNVDWCANKIATFIDSLDPTTKINNARS